MTAVNKFAYLPTIFRFLFLVYCNAISTFFLLFTLSDMEEVAAVLGAEITGNTRTVETKTLVASEVAMTTTQDLVETVASTIMAEEALASTVLSSIPSRISMLIGEEHRTCVPMLPMIGLITEL